MKILIIAENAEIVGFFKNSFKSRGEIIVYSSIIKALDNIEEIDPALAIICAAEFPRHWKLFAQHLRAAYSGQCKVFLVVDEKFNDSEKRKAAALGIGKIIPEAELLSQGFDSGEETFAAPPRAEQQARPEQEPRPARIPQPPPEPVVPAPAWSAPSKAPAYRPPVYDSSNAELLFRHPRRGSLVTGTVESVKNSTLIFRPDDKEIARSFRDGQMIESAPLKTGDSITLIDAEVIPKGAFLELRIKNTHPRSLYG